MSYAPSAPPEIWAVQDIDAGTKITVMAMWSWAEHDDQREARTTTVYAKMREGMTPTECLISKLVEQTGAKPRAIREHLTKAKAAGYATIKGLAATLHWPPAHDAKRCGVKNRRHSVKNQRCSVNAVASENDAITSTADAMASKSNATASENDATASHQLTPPIPHTPQDPQAPLPGLGVQCALVDSGKSDDEQIAQFWDWYNAQRADAWARWRPDQRIGTIELLPDRRKKLLRLCRRNAPKGASIEQQLAVARKVIAVARREIDRDRARVMDSGWDSMRRIGDYWLRQEHFDRMAGEPEPAQSRSDDYAPRDDDAFWDDPIAWQGLRDDDDSHRPNYVEEQRE